MLSNREAIQKLRQYLQEAGADSHYTNRFLYLALKEQAKWLIKREVSAGRIYRNNSVFQTLRNREVVEVPIIDTCLNINTKCKIYRTKQPLPDIWMDNDGHVIKQVASLDYSTSFTPTTLTTWSAKQDDPYQQLSKEKYYYVQDGYLWFPKHNPHFIHILGLFMDDVNTVPNGDCVGCQQSECVRFLDTRFILPDWVEAEMYAKAVQQLAGVTLRLPEDNQIDKNPSRKN